MEPEQVEEFKAATSLLPHLVQNFEKAEKVKKQLAERAARDAELNRIHENPASAWPDLRRTDSDGLSDITLPVNQESNDQGERVKDIDCESVWSVAHPATR